MIKYKLLKDNGFTPKSITKNKNAYIIDTENGKYVIKKDESHLDKTYNYLLPRGFNYYPNYYIKSHNLNKGIMFIFEDYDDWKKHHSKDVSTCS